MEILGSNTVFHLYENTQTHRNQTLFLLALVRSVGADGVVSYELGLGSSGGVLW